MQYLYKKNSSYIYKRRIPNTNKFYIFNTTFSNYKKASKFVIIFNKITRDIFEYIKQKGKFMSLNFSEIYEILGEYKQKALEEYSNYEEKRHQHIGQLFKIKKEDPLLGEIVLNGAEPEVIKVALDSFKTLAIGDYDKTKKHLAKHSKDIIERGTLKLKNLYREIKKNANEVDLSTFLTMLIKAEAEILKEDYLRATHRFSTENIMKANNSNKNYELEDNQSYIETQQQKYIPITNIVEDFLFSHCGYTRDVVSDSKSNASKVRKVVEIFLDLIIDKNMELISQSITLDILKECFNIIPKTPMKPKNQIGSYSFYFAYKENKNALKEELRAEKTIKQDLTSFNRFIKYLTVKKFITADELLELETHLGNIRKTINSKVINSELKEEQIRTSFKDGMLQKIFNKNHRPYSILFNKLANCKNKNKDILLARFLVPIVLFFTGARPAEITFLKTTDCEIQNIKGEERIVLYLEANELKGSKTRQSKRIVIVHDFLAKELNFLNFIKNAIKEKREFLFNAVEDFETKISVEFNRNKEFLEGNISKIDSFRNLTYSLYSFRHTYKTHMLSKNIAETVIHKIQGHIVNDVAAGYFSITEDLIDTLNLFDKHLIINWEDVKTITDRF